MDSANILVAAKDRSIIDKVKQCFDSMGHQIIPAYDVTLGFFLAQKNFPFLILCQPELNEGDAFIFLAELKSDPELSSIPFVLIDHEIAKNPNTANLEEPGIAMVVDASSTEGYLISELIPLLNKSISNRKKRQEYSPE